MKKGILFALFGVLLMCSTVFAEASFDDIQGLIKKQDYNAAIVGLDLIIKNHPHSAKAYYTMAQAQAGAGNLVKAREALDTAKGIDPKLKFAPSSNVEHLAEAITPQTKKVEAIESHGLRNFLILFLLIGAGIGIYVFIRNSREDEHAAPVYVAMPDTVEDDHVEPAKPTSWAGFPRSAEKPVYNSRPAPSRPTPASPSVVRQTTVINNHTTVVDNGGSDGFAAGVVTGVVGELLSRPHHETVVEREYVPAYTPAPVREEPAPAPTRSSWVDDSPAPTKSSSWEDSTPTKSSSWEDSTPTKSSTWDDPTPTQSSTSEDSSSSSSWD